MSVDVLEDGLNKTFSCSASTALSSAQVLDSEQKEAMLVSLRPQFKSQPGKNVGEGVVIGKFEVVGSDD